jgi:hypothetical protein
MSFFAMIPKKSRKSSNLKQAQGAGIGDAPPAGFPLHGAAGLALIAAGHILLATGNHFAGVYFTPMQWTGYILFLDALIKRRKGRSLMADNPLEFALLLVISILGWLIFEAYNLLLQNWRYVGLPENRLYRYVGYAWSFATIFPGIFFTYELIGLLRPDAGTRAGRPARLGRGTFVALVLAGAVSLAVPLIRPSTYMTPLIWIGFVLLLDPLNFRLGERSVLAELFSGRRTALCRFFLSGLICGILWEFWNYRAAAKWEYDVPYLGDVKIFEMPVLGFLGFLPFSIECFALYTFMRKLIPIPRREKYLG